MNEVTPRLIAALVAGDIYVSDELTWASPETQVKAQAILDGLDLVWRGQDLKPFLIERYVENLYFKDIGARHGHGAEWARSRIARALRLARGQLRGLRDELRALIT